MESAMVMKLWEYISKLIIYILSLVLDTMFTLWKQNPTFI